MLSIVFIFNLSLTSHVNLNSNFRSRFSIPSQCSPGPVGRLILLADILTSNKSALRRIASFAFGFVRRKLDSIHSRNVGSKLGWDDIAHSCYDQVSKQGIPSPVPYDLINGPRFWPIEVTHFFEVFRWQVSRFQQIAVSTLVILTETAYEIRSVLLSQRPDLDLNFV